MKKDNSSIKRSGGEVIQLGDIIEVLAELNNYHTHPSKFYDFIKRISEKVIKESHFVLCDPEPVSFMPFGDIFFPYEKMGAIDTLDLFGVDELIIFAFYWANRSRYKKVADIGANLGLHSIIMSKCGWDVEAYEPDPTHFAQLKHNLHLNKLDQVKLKQVAVSDEEGELEFVRVLGNTTSSHLAGAKNNPYGELERFQVSVESVSKILPNVDLVKMDVEGQEQKIILSTERAHWSNTDMMVEVGSIENAKAIYEHLKLLGINAFAQKRNWGSVECESDMPTSYKEGSLFISAKPKMIW